MVAVAQLVEPRVVVPVVEGSSPFSHPNYFLGHCELLGIVLILTPIRLGR